MFIAWENFSDQILGLHLVQGHVFVSCGQSSYPCDCISYHTSCRENVISDVLICSDDVTSLDHWTLCYRAHRTPADRIVVDIKLNKNYISICYLTIYSMSKYTNLSALCDLNNKPTGYFSYAMNKPNSTFTGHLITNSDSLTHLYLYS